MPPANDFSMDGAMARRLAEAWVLDGLIVGPGDLVEVGPSRAGRRDGFVGVARRAHLDPGSGEVEALEVFGGPSGRAATRTVRPARIRSVVRRVGRD